MDSRSDQTVPPTSDQPPQDLLVEEQETLTAEETNGAGGESVTPPPPPPPPPVQHDNALFPELPSPEEFEDILRTAGRKYGELKKLRLTQEEVLRRRFAAECQGDTMSTIDFVAEAVLLWRIQEMQLDLENSMEQIGWILQGIVVIESEIEASTYEAAVALCQTMVEQMIDLAVEQEAEGEGATAAGEGDASRAAQADAQLACLRCGEAAATVAVMPCNHLCLCVDCGGDGSVEVCPECNGVSTGTVLVGL